MDDTIKSLVDAPLANALKLNIVEVEGKPKKRTPSKRTMSMFQAPAPIMKNAKDYKQREAERKTTELLDYYIGKGFSVEKIHEYTRIDIETIKRGMEIRK